MRRLLVSAPRDAPDLRPALLSVVALMFLLLPFVLLTTSPEKLAGLGLALAAEGGAAAAVNPGPVERVEIGVGEETIVVRASVRSTDVTAEAGDTQVVETLIPSRDGAPDLAALQGRLGELRRLDPHQTRATVIPDDRLSTARVMALVDAVRGGASGELYAEVVLGSADDASLAAPADVPPETAANGPPVDGTGVPR